MRRALTLVVCSAAIIAAPARRITTVAGTGYAGYMGDGGPAIEAEISNPYGLTLGPDNALYFCEIDNHCVRRLDLRLRELTTVAGNRRQGYSGDGGPALSASLNQPYDVRFDAAGNMFIVDMQNHVVRRVDMKTKTISTVAGVGRPGFGGDGGPATRALLRQPHSISFDPQGRLLICDTGNNRVRRWDPKTGIIETWAGTGERRATVENVPFTSVALHGPRAIDFDAKGNAYVLLREGNAIYRVDSGDGHVRLVAGTGEQGNTGDGGAARLARLNGPKGLAWSADNSLYIADTENHTIRRVDLKSGIISTVAGTGDRGDGPDGDAFKCKLARPHGVCAGRRGVVFIADSENHRIRVLREPPPPPEPRPSDDARKTAPKKEVQPPTGERPPEPAKTPPKASPAEKSFTPRRSK